MTTTPIVWVDSRVGSKELVGSLENAGLKTELTTLHAADFAFEGNGPEGPCMVGVERKAIGDLVTSIRDKRINAQMAKMAIAYDFGWLVVEGAWGQDQSGKLVSRRGAGFSGAKRLPGGFTEDGLAKALLSLELKGMDGKLRLRQTFSKRGTAVFVAALVHWWTDKPWSGHLSHLGSYEPEHYTKLSQFREIVQKLTGVGLAASSALETAYVGSLGQLMKASIETVANVSVKTPVGLRRLGPAKATRIVEELRRLA
jgi:ERCC4-type nuclease